MVILSLVDKMKENEDFCSLLSIYVRYACYDKRKDVIVIAL